MTSSRASLRPRGLTLDGVYVAAAVALTAIVPLLWRIAPHDFWWHMATGRLIVREGRIPTVDAFSFTHAGEPFFNQSWLAQVLMYALNQAGGLPLLIVFQAALMVAANLLLLWMVARKTGHLRLSVALLLIAVEPNAYTNWHIRPQSYAIPLFAAYLVILAGYRARWWRWLWPLVPLMALWVNLHGSFVLGLGMMGIVLLGEGVRRRAGDSEVLSWGEWRRLAAYAVAVAGAVLVNPRGAAVFGYVANLLTSKTVVEVVTEWASPTPREFVGMLFFVLMISLFVAMTYARRRPPLTDLLLVLAFLWLALSAGRNVVWFAMIAYLPLAEALWRTGDGGRGTGDGGRGTRDQTPETTDHGPQTTDHEPETTDHGPQTTGLRTGPTTGLLHPFTPSPPHPLTPSPPHPLTPSPRPPSPVPARANALIVAFLGIGVVLALPWFRAALPLAPEMRALVTEDTPVAAVEALRRLPAGERPRRLFHSTGTGSYLIWAAPEQRVFADSRFEFYPMQQITDYKFLRAGCDVAELLAKYRIDGLLLDQKSMAELEWRALRTGSWRVVYRDASAVLMLPAGR